MSNLTKNAAQAFKAWRNTGSIGKSEKFFAEVEDVIDEQIATRKRNITSLRKRLEQALGIYKIEFALNIDETRIKDAADREDYAKSYVASLINYDSTGVGSRNSSVTNLNREINKLKMELKACNDVKKFLTELQAPIEDTEDIIE